MENKNLRTIKNYANSVTLDSTGKNPSVQYVYRLIEQGIIEGENIDGVNFIDYSIEVEGVTKLNQ